MAKGWKNMGTNALENNNPENEIDDPKEKIRIKRMRRRKMFKDTMKIDRMEIDKKKYAAAGVTNRKNQTNGED